MPGIVDVRAASIGSPPYSWRYIIRPLNLGLIGLAVAVALWGFAYKLSLYRPHQNHPASMSVAKLWLGPDRTVLISKIRPKCQLQQRWTLDSVLAKQSETPAEADNGLLTVTEVAAAGRNHFANYIPRSPPPQMS
jgi:hypothetical protein